MGDRTFKCMVRWGESGALVSWVDPAGVEHYACLFEAEALDLLGEPPAEREGFRVVAIREEDIHADV